MRRATFTNRALLALLASLVVALALGESPEPTKVRITTWNLEWFPNGSAHDATPEMQAQRIAAAADVLRPIDPDIILLQEVRDYDACARLGEAIAPGTLSRRNLLCVQGTASEWIRVNSKLRSCPNTKLKRHGQSAGSR